MPNAGYGNKETVTRGDSTDLSGEGRVFQDAGSPSQDSRPRSPARGRSSRERVDTRGGYRVLAPFSAVGHHASREFGAGSQRRGHGGLHGQQSDGLRTPRRGQENSEFLTRRDPRSPGRTRINRGTAPTFPPFVAHSSDRCAETSGIAMSARSE